MGLLIWVLIKPLKRHYKQRQKGHCSHMPLFIALICILIPFSVNGAKSYGCLRVNKFQQEPTFSFGLKKIPEPWALKFVTPIRKSIVCCDLFWQLHYWVHVNQDKWQYRKAAQTAPNYTLRNFSLHGAGNREWVMAFQRVRFHQQTCINHSWLYWW